MKVRLVEKLQDLEKGVDSLLLILEKPSDFSPQFVEVEMKYISASANFSKFGELTPILSSANIPWRLLVTKSQWKELAVYLGTASSDEDASYAWNHSPDTIDQDYIHYDPFSLSSCYYRDATGRNIMKTVQLWGFSSKTKKELKKLEKSQNMDFTAKYPYKCRLKAGFDPELFVRNFTTNNLIPAFAFLPTLESAKAVHYPYSDGFAAEFQTRPHVCFAYAVDEIQAQLMDLEVIAQRNNGYLTLDNVVRIPRINQYSEEHTILGCDASMNAYDVPSPTLDPRMPLRTAGFHIHFGHENFKYIAQSEVKRLIRLFDYYVAVPNMLMLEGLESIGRRQYYGIPGEFRRPPHGIEYRVLSSTTLVSPLLVHIALEVGRNLIGAAWSGNIEKFEKRLPSLEELFAVLQTSDYTTARAKYLPRIKEDITELFSIGVSQKNTINELISHRAKEFLPSTSIRENWRLFTKVDGKETWINHCGGANSCLGKCEISFTRQKTATF